MSNLFIRNIVFSVRFQIRSQTPVVAVGMGSHSSLSLQTQVRSSKLTTKKQPSKCELEKDQRERQNRAFATSSQTTIVQPPEHPKNVAGLAAIFFQKKISRKFIFAEIEIRSAKSENFVIARDFSNLYRIFVGGFCFSTGL